jgi:Spy/CpxP family protein refolding chaperone
MKKTKLLVLMFSAMLIAGTAIGQQNKANRDGERAKKECTSFISDLSADQEAAIDKIHTEKRGMMQQLSADLRIKEAELAKLRIDENASESALNSKVDEISNIKAQMQKLHIKAEQDIRKLLTEKQRLEFDQHCQHKHKAAHHGNHNQGIHDCNHAPKGPHDCNHRPNKKPCNTDK